MGDLFEKKQLTAEDRELIREYALSLVFLPATILTVVGFALGWFINEGARGAAYSDAFSKAQVEIVKLASEAAKASAQAEVSASSANNALTSATAANKKLNNALSNIENIANKAEANFKTLETLSAAEEGLAESVAGQLLDNPESLASAIAPELSSRIKKLERELSERFDFLASSEYQKLWSGETAGGPHIVDVGAFVPNTAKAVILNVISISTGSEGGSVVCADADGNFNTSLWHYQNITNSNYGNVWAGGVVICPIGESRTLRWGMFDNKSISQPTSSGQSYGTLVGWL